MRWPWRQATYEYWGSEDQRISHWLIWIDVRLSRCGGLLLNAIFQYEPTLSPLLSNDFLGGW